MKPEYIELTRKGLKTATTRMRKHGFCQYKLVSGNRFDAKDSGVVIEIDRITSYTPQDISEAHNAPVRMEIIKAEHFKSWKEFMDVLGKLNGKPITAKTQLYTHFYKMVVNLG
jgi:hypothetical protein